MNIEDKHVEASEAGRVGMFSFRNGMNPIMPSPRPRSAENASNVCMCVCMYVCMYVQARMDKLAFSGMDPTSISMPAS